MSGAAAEACPSSDSSCEGAEAAEDAAEALAPLGAKAAVEDDLDRLVARIVAEARSGDQILVMSNGGFGGIHGKILERLVG